MCFHFVSVCFDGMGICFPFCVCVCVRGEENEGYKSEKKAAKLNATDCHSIDCRSLCHLNDW